MNVLIVDDEEVLQDVLVTLLRKAGYKPLTATSGEALEIRKRTD
jgi:CheY-like chemotaxis protein